MLEAVRLSQESRKKKVLKIWLEPSVEAKVESKVQAAAEPAAAAEEPSVEFLEDVTLPDGAEAKGAVRKVWKVKNNGSAAWPEGCFLHGDNDVKVAIPSVQPEEECLVSVDIQLPAQAGAFKKMFRLVSDPPFTGDTNLWVQLKIPAEVEPVPQPAEQEQKLSDAEEAAIAMLTEMGFTDKSMLVSLLEAAGGNVQTVLGWLMAQAN